MTWVDWVIVIVMVGSVIGGLTQGLFRSVCSLCGLIFGLLLAAWNYWRVAAVVLPLVRIQAVADTIGFLLIAFLVMGIAALIGHLLAKIMHAIGLGCLDSLAGGVFGFLQGALVITILILAVVAFYPKAQWLAEAKLPQYFVGACHVTMRVSPAELSNRVREGLKTMEEKVPEWLHPPAS